MTLLFTRGSQLTHHQSPLQNILRKLELGIHTQVSEVHWFYHYIFGTPPCRIFYNDAGME